MYGIDPDEFGHRVQVGVACSTSVSPLPGKGRGLQLLIQGNQVNFVADLLLGELKLPHSTLFPFKHRRISVVSAEFNQEFAPTFA